MMLAEKIIAYMRAKKYRIAEGEGQVNIVYLEGANADGTPNADKLDGWNDRRMIIAFEDGKPKILLNAEATTEPGAAATYSQAARKRGGVARVQLTQYLSNFKVGFHKGKTHPALVQSGTILVHRDKNRDGLRTGDAVSKAFGINQHGTRPYWSGSTVGTWSEGCLVGRRWAEHLRFIAILKTDLRYLADNDFLFDTTIIDTSDFAKFR